MEGRITRALTQKMYMIDCTEKKNGFVCTVEGSTGKHYLVELKKVDGCCCDCPDFEKRGEMCKHIFFVLVRVAKTPVSEVATDADTFVLSDDLVTRIKNATDPTHAVTESFEARLTNECGVCYEDFTEIDKDLRKCTTCLKALHDSCMELWIRSCATRGHPCTCPYCRGYMSTASKRTREEDDCLSKLAVRPPPVKRTRRSGTIVSVVAVDVVAAVTPTK